MGLGSDPFSGPHSPVVGMDEKQLCPGGDDGDHTKNNSWLAQCSGP